MDNSTTPQDSAAMSPASTGSVEGAPVAWEVLLPRVGTYDIHSFQWEAEAIVDALRLQGTIAKVVPLYRQPQPTLTVEEREAIERLCDAAFDMIADDKCAGGCHWQADAAAVEVVRGLLERLK